MWLQPQILIIFGRVHLELGFYIMTLLSNILQMLSPGGEYIPRGTDCFKIKLFFKSHVPIFCIINTWAALRAAGSQPRAACSLQLKHHPQWSSARPQTSPIVPLPPLWTWAITRRFSTGIPRMQTGFPNWPHHASGGKKTTGLWTLLCHHTVGLWPS